MTAGTAPPRLLHFRVSHFNEKVRWALDFKGWPHTRETQLPGLHIVKARRLTGQNKLPILIVDGRALHDSHAILAEIERLRPDPPLFPADPAGRARAREIERYYDAEVAPALRRLFWSAYFDRPADAARMAADGFGRAVEGVWRALFPMLRAGFRGNLGMDRESLRRARERMPGYFERLAAEVGPSGYLVGDRFGVADLAAAAVMTAIVRPPEFPYPLPEPWPPALAELRASVEALPGFQWVLDIYRRHRGESCEIARPV